MSWFDLFDLAAPFYARLTQNRLWRESVREMARHLPPSGPELRLLDLGTGPANSALELFRLRPDLRIVAANRSRGMLRQARRALIHRSCIRLCAAEACALPLAADSLDAITAHSVFYLIPPPQQAVFLAEALRVLRPGGRLIMLDPARVPYPLSVIGRAPRSAASVLAWHAVSRTHQRATPEAMARTLEQSGFARVLGERAVKGYGVLSRGEKPFGKLTPIERTAAVAGLDQLSADLTALNPARALDGVRGRAVFLLIQQTPNKPAWQPGEVIIWGAATATDRHTGQPVALAFSSLPKAVEFMQPAVVGGLLIGINKVAKFDKAVAARWDFPILLNPPLSALQTHYDLPGPLIGVEPNSAVMGEE